MVIVTVVVVVLVGMAWSNRSSETWVEVSAQDMRLAVGASGQLSAAFQYKAPFLWHSAARPIAATIQLISFPEAVDVTPTTQVTSDGAPTAVLTVRGLKPGTEELVIAGSDTPRGAESWRTTSLKVFVVKPKP